MSGCDRDDPEWENGLKRSGIRDGSGDHRDMETPHHTRAHSLTHEKNQTEDGLLQHRYSLRLVLVDSAPHYCYSNLGLVLPAASPVCALSPACCTKQEKGRSSIEVEQMGQMGQMGRLLVTSVGQCGNRGVGGVQHV